MEFDEPDLEDLIQSDLRTEMNKILSQSEVDEFEANSSEGPNSTQELSMSSISSSVTDIPCSSRMMRAQDETVKKEILADNSWPDGLIVSGDFDMIDCSMIQALTQNKMSFSSSSSHLHPEISGHFSMESYPDFGGDMPLCPQSVAEHNDLSSLTWLTTVDVQALQKLSEQGAAMSMPMANALCDPGNQTYCSQPKVTSMDRSTCNITCEMNTVNPAPSTMIQSTATVNESCLNSNVNVVNSLPPQPACSGTSSSGTVSSYMRYTPIQPNCVQADRRFAAQQRYRLQPHPSNAGHQYDGGRIGPHRYMPSAMVGHPYHPPPPYAPRGDYVHGASLMHSRFHSHSHQQKVYPKPVYSYSCLIAMALTDSKTGCLPVSDIYSFMMENYPYFKTAPDGWKNSVRHNLSLNKCFEKVEKPNGTQRKGCLWALNPAKINKMKEEVQKWKRKDPDAIRRSMSNPEQLDRELEEMRRADEEAARRRMLSLSSHGLTTSAVHPHSHPQQLHHSHHAGQFHLQHSAIHQHLNSPTAGPSSLPTTPIRRQGQHFSPELAQHHFALALARSASQPPLGHNPFDLSPMSSSSPHGIPGTPNSLNVGSNNNNNSFPSNSSPDKIILSSGSGRTAFFASPQSSSSNSSGNASLLGTLTSSLPEVGNEFTDIELDASLADLAALQDSFWDGALTSQASASSDIGDVFASSEENQTPSSSSATTSDIPTTTITGSHTVLPPLIRVLSTKTQDGSPDSTVFDSSTNQRADNFSHDLTQFANNNNKSVMLL